MSVRAAERPGHRSTTRHAQAIYPFIPSDGLGGRGVFVGRDSAGGAFCFDPWVLYGEGILDDPNAIVLGKLGQGKSALVKTLLWRMLLFGRRAFVLDIKREYGPLCQAAGVAPISLVPGGNLRLNPLASRPEEHAQLELLRAVTITALGGPLTQAESGALREALRTVRLSGVAEPTLPEIAHVLFHPVAEMAERLRTTPEQLAADARRAALALQDLCEGPLRGMFDGPTTPGLDLDAPLVVLNLRAVLNTHTTALGILMTCATAWLQAMIDAETDARSAKRIVVVDEAWRILSNLGIGEWLQQSFKLSRGLGAQNVVVMHRLSDLRSTGAEGSREVRLAEGLLADAETKIIYAQPPDQLPQTRELLGLTDTEAELLPHLRRGWALWKVGQRSFLVQHRLSASEHELVDTDARMAVKAVA